MLERELTQSVRDHQIDEWKALDAFGVLELSLGVLFLTVGLYKFIPAAQTLMEASNYAESIVNNARNDLYVASAFLLGAIVEVSLSEMVRGRYQERTHNPPAA